MTTPPTTSTTGETAIPPWQVRWKRPQWDRVVLGIDESSVNADTSNGSDGGEHHEEYEEIQDELDQSWTPISCSSVVLTRKEARMAMLELQRRDRLLIRRKRKRRQRHHAKARNDSASEEGEPTPRNKNSKAKVVLRATSPLPYDKSRNARGGNSKHNVRTSSLADDEAAGEQLNAAAGAIMGTPKSPPSKSITPSSWWFKSITSPGKGYKPTKNKSGKPPRISTSSIKPSTSNRVHDITSPSSPTSFSTFNLNTPPPNNRNSNESDNNDDSPPEITDASCASSLLWEDMTLTSVSEEDAAAFRLFGANQRANKSKAGPAAAQVVGAAVQDGARKGGGEGGRRLFNPASDFGGGRYYYDRRGHVRLSDWDGFDNVVLSVTVFATTNSASAGEVVVMELLSTKDPPLDNDTSAARAFNNSAAAHSKSKQEAGIKISSSSSNSSFTSPSSSSAAPPPPPQLPPRLPGAASAAGGGASSGGGSASGEDDSTSSTKHTTRTNPSQKLAANDDDEEGNHTRILARRVLWWPSSIKSRDRSLDECPAFVSLGRTSIWKECKQDLDEQSASLVNDENDDGDGNAEEEDSDNEGLDDNYRDKKENRNEKQSSLDDVGQDEQAADAMEVFRSLNFLFGGESPPPVTTSNKSAPLEKSTSSSEDDKKQQNDVSNHNGQQKKKKLTQPLSMCLITQDGHIHFYYALRVLLSSGKSNNDNSNWGGKSSSNSMDLSNSFAAFLLGSELFTKVNEGVLPLSHPHATMQLSQLEGSMKGTSSSGEDQRQKGIGSDYGASDDPPIWEKCLSTCGTAGTSNSEVELMENDEPKSSQGNWSSLGTFDASIDPSSLPLRTIRQSNVLSGTCITSDTSNAYLAICGKGLRRIIHKDGRHGGRSRVGHVLGGFVTFVSLRHCAESRTIYLPFAPASIQPIYWMGMHFVVLLGEEGPPTSMHQEKGGCLRLRRRPCVIAVRVDCKQGERGDHNAVFSSGGNTSFDMDSEHNVLPFVPRTAERRDSAFMPMRSSSLEAFPDPLVQSSAVDGGARQNIPNRFQCVSIKLPSVGESLSNLFPSDEGHHLDGITSKPLAISSIPSSPPGIILSFQSHSTVAVVNHTLLPFQTDFGDGLAAGAATISLPAVVRPGHRALLGAGRTESFSSSSATVLTENISVLNVSCTGGQGWSLVGIQGTGQRSYFICWDGAMDDNKGPFILPLQHGLLNEGFQAKYLTSSVMPLMSSVKYAEKLTEISHHRVVAKLPSVSKPYSLPSFLQQDEADGGFPSGFTPNKSFSVTLKESIKIAAKIEGGLDDIIVNALDSISTPHHQSPDSRAKSMSTGGVGRANRSKGLVMSHQEKSKRLLRQCSSWTDLSDTKANRGIVHGQVIVATIRLGTQFQSLTLRTNIVANPITTPFNHVLSWLCQRRDYYTAASVALSLLDDADAVYELCGIPKTLEEELTHHKGLIDSIKPLGDDSAHGHLSETLTSLADMAVGCLIKGGASMSKTLEGFLARNTLYNAPRACLMLVGATILAVSKDTTPKPRVNKNDSIVDMLSTVETPSEDLIWPVRCLIKMAVVRRCLPSAILMLNATIPNELRWRAPKSRGLASAPRPSLGLFLALVNIILESTEEATRYFLNMMDEESGSPYWLSIDDDTKLALSLVSIRGKHVMLLEPEVRTWALDRLKEEIESPTGSAYNALLPDGWLREIVTGVLCNAECDIGLGLMLITDTTSKSGPSNDEKAVCYRQDMLRVRELLVPQKHSSGLDYDLLISALLILARRGRDWREGEGTQISTQTLLNTVCDMAGRKTDVEPKFLFDGATVMRQCAMADNLQAASFLVGGKKGLVIECADLIVVNLETTVKDAEIALFVGSLVELKGVVAPIYEGMAPQEKLIFMPNGCHQHLMWLLQEHVLNVHTYGSFDSTPNTGKMTPVFAGRVCFRAWYCLTPPSILGISAKWLEGWLRRKLELANGKSSRRLACAALVRTLLWADEAEDLDLSDGDDEPLLAALIGFDGRFMSELAHACCGLIQSIPPHLAEELSAMITI